MEDLTAGSPRRLDEVGLNPSSPSPAPQAAPTNQPKSKGPLYLLTGGLVAILIGGGGYYLATNQQTTAPTPVATVETSPTPTQAPDETVNWKTYTNEKYKYSIKYPADLKVDTPQSPFSKEGVYLTDPQEPPPQEFSEANYFLIFADTLKTSQQIQDYAKLDCSNAEQTGSSKVNSYDAVEFTSYCVDKEKFLILQKDRTGYYFQHFSREGSTSNQSKIVTASNFEKILTTFKFLDSSAADKVISTEVTSPDGFYTVAEDMTGDYNTISVKKKSGQFVTKDLIKDNEKEISSRKLAGQYGFNFKGWVSDNTFVLSWVFGNGSEYSYTVDAATGKFNAASFKKVK